MADIERNMDGDLIEKDHELKIMDLNVLLNEKLNQLKALEVHLDKLRTVEVKRIEFKKAHLSAEIENLKAHIQRISVIDIKKQK